MLKLIKALKVLLILSIVAQTVIAINNNSMGNSNIRNSNANPNGPAYIMNGGLTTNPNGTIIMGGSPYNEADGQYIPLQQGVDRNATTNEPSNINNNPDNP